MNHQHRSATGTREAVMDTGVFPGLIGLTEPLTELVSGAIAALRGLRSSLREKAHRRRTLDALNRLDPRMLADIGLERGDLIEVAGRNLPLDELARRRHAHPTRWRGHLDTVATSRRPAVNDEHFRLVA